MSTRGSSSATAKERSTWVSAMGWQSGHQFRGALGGHDARHFRHRQHVALGQRLLFQQPQRLRGHPDPRAGPGRAPGRLFAAHVDHAGIAAAVHVAEAQFVRVHPTLPPGTYPGRSCPATRSCRKSWPRAIRLMTAMHHVQVASLHGRLHVDLVAREQAVLQPAVGGQAQAVAFAAEVVGDRADEADGAGVPGEAIVVGGAPSSRREHRLELARIPARPVPAGPAMQIGLGHRIAPLPRGPHPPTSIHSMKRTCSGRSRVRVDEAGQFAHAPRAS